MRTWALACQLCGKRLQGVPTSRLWLYSASHARTCPRLPAAAAFRLSRAPGRSLRERLLLEDGRTWLEITLEPGAPAGAAHPRRRPPPRDRARPGPTRGPHQQPLLERPVS